jgi:hypothetical protein
MATATLDVPITVNPLAATKLVIRSILIEPAATALTIRYDMVDATGHVVDSRTITSQAPVVQSYVATQEAAVYAKLLAFLGVTATVA